MDVVADLAAEQQQLEDLLSGLDDEQWAAPSAALGWSIGDVVLHLAQTEEAVSFTVSAAGAPPMWQRGEQTVDSAAEAAVRAQRDSGRVIFERWRTARRAALDALRQADPNQRVAWVAAPLKPQALATTRLAEHWAHALDIAPVLGLPYPDTDRLRHIAWLGHRTLPYAFGVEGLEPHEVSCELTGPGGDTWTFGPPEADSSIRGSAAEFCRVGARRLRPDQTSLAVDGPHAADALRVLRNYAA